MMAVRKPGGGGRHSDQWDYLLAGLNNVLQDRTRLLSGCPRVNRCHELTAVPFELVFFDPVIIAAAVFTSGSLAFPITRTGLSLPRISGAGNL